MIKNNKIWNVVIYNVYDSYKQKGNESHVICSLL